MNRSLVNILNKYPLLKKAWRAARNFSPPGFQDIPFYDVVYLFYKEVQKDGLTMRAAAISFHFLLAIFPLSIFLLTLIPYIPIKHFDTTLLTYFENILPESIFSELESLLIDIIQRPKSGLLSINFILAIYFSTNGVMAMMRGFDKVNQTFKRRKWVEKFWASLRINTLIIFQIIIVVTLLILSAEQLERLLSFLKINISLRQSLFLQGLIRTLLVIISFFNTIALIYYFGPAVKKKYKYFSVGATFATILGLVTSYIFSVYIKYFFERINSLYGSLSIIIILMIWIYLNSLVLIFGFELNNSIALNKTLASKEEN